MYINEKQVFKKTIVSLALLNLFSFLVYYLTTVSLPSEATHYVRAYYEEIADVLIPLFAAVSLYIIYSAKGAKITAISALLFSLTWIIHYFPYYAFDYAIAGAYIDEVFYYSALATLIAIAIELVKILILFSAIALAARFRAKKIKLSKRKYKDILENCYTLDFRAPITVGFFAAALVIFLYKLGFELYATITFIIDNSYSFSIITTGEIFYISFRYIFILALLFAAHFGSFFVKTRLLRSNEVEEESYAPPKNEVKSEEIREVETND